MKQTKLLALGGCGLATLLAFPASDAQAVYVGLSTSFFVANVAGVNRNVFRVYAQFSNPDDYLKVGIGSPTLGPMTILSRNLTDTGAGSNFYNPVSSHGNAPSPTEVFGGVGSKTTPIPPTPNAAFDTFFTIGVGAGQAGTGPGGSDMTENLLMPIDFISGNSFTTSNADFFTLATQEQGRAGWTGDGDPALRVLLFQLVVSSTSIVKGTVNIYGDNHLGPGFDQEFVAAQQTFFIPVPGGLALLGVAAIGLGRRRRLDCCARQFP